MEKIKSLSYKQTLAKSNDSTEKTEKKNQELVELETQYEHLSKAQEDLKQKMQLLELAQKKSNLSNKPTGKLEAKASTSGEAELSGLNASIFRRSKPG